ncbi:MAG: hypothetical protein IJ418_02360 [Clostridia bacterium]|nr:hypothetical protein [Clostridia bacterium]
MPRVRPLTEALRKEDAARQQKERVIRIISAASAALGYDRIQVAKKAGIEYQTYCHRMRGASDFRLPEISGVADALSLDAVSRAALCGAKEKCRYEPGYRPERAGASGA